MNKNSHGISNYFIHDINYWKIKCLHNMFCFLSALSIFAYIPSTIIAYGNKTPGVIVITTIAYAILLFLTRNKKLNYKTKGLIIMIASYIMATYLLMFIGPTSSGSVWFVLFSIFACVTFGIKTTILSSILILLAYLAIIYEYRFLNNQENIRLIIIQCASTLIISTTSAISISLVLNGFSKTLNKLFATKKATILGLAKLAEHRDNDTGYHILRLQEYVGIIADYLYKHNNKDGYITPDYIDDMKVSSVLHDIGKVGIKDSILQKPGKLTFEEFEEMKKHTMLGGEVISEIERNIMGRSVYSIGKEIAFYHHEKWNGKGYPKGLSGDEIPLSARIVALVDVYDALTTRRPYKEPYTHEEALSIITMESGEHFDPEIVNALIMCELSFKNISSRLYPIEDSSEEEAFSLNLG